MTDNSIINTTFKIRRGLKVNWEKNNPILEKGEPGFVVDENRLKIGDGIHAWLDLPYLGDSGVVNASYHYDFPSIGSVDKIYKAEKEKKLYQWNPEKLVYESIGEGDGIIEIEIIHGGNANGTRIS